MWEKNEMEDKIKKEAKEAVESVIIGKLELERRERKKKRRKKFFKRLARLIFICFWVSVGFFIGVHRKQIIEYFETGKCPKIPKNHPCPFLK
ncbi:MAG TPA: hypothetical protein DCR12_00355 [Lachnospiraceae bacterium]|nr:hypothetical protein [Lachnospiraceae bacterium]